jgi:phospholipid/cholesterol/gamma-HCH transport system substrate-binding protein
MCLAPEAEDQEADVQQRQSVARDRVLRCTGAMSNQSRAIEFKVGLLILVALGVLAAMLLTMGKFAFGEGYRFTVDFEFIGSLHRSAPVKLAGIRVGKVLSIEHIAQGRVDSQSGKRLFIRVQLWLEEAYRGTVHQDAEFFINRQGVLGEEYVEIVPGTDRMAPIKDGAVAVGVTPPRTDLIVARLYEFLDGATKLLRRDKDAIGDLLRASTRVITTADKILGKNEDKLAALLNNLESLSAEAGQLIKTVRSGVGDATRVRSILINVERTTGLLAKNLDGLIANASTALNSANDLLRTLGPEERKQIQRSLKQLSQLSERAAQIAGKAHGMVSQLSRGKGTAGALLVRDELYDDLKEMVRDLKRNPWKFLWRE